MRRRLLGMIAGAALVLATAGVLRTVRVGDEGPTPGGAIF